MKALMTWHFFAAVVNRRALCRSTLFCRILHRWRTGLLRHQVGAVWSTPGDLSSVMPSYKQHPLPVREPGFKSRTW